MCFRVWKNIPPNERQNWNRMNEGQRRYAWEQYNLALVRRGLPINHPIPVLDNESEGESVYETAQEDNDVSDSDTLIGDLLSDNEDIDMAPVDPQPSTSKDTTEGGKGVGKGTKRKKTNDSGVSTGFSLPGTAADQGAGGSGGSAEELQPVSLPSPTSNIHSHIRYYRKVHRFLTYGIAYQVLEKIIPGTPPQTYRFITTPFAQVPWDRPYMYINTAEFHALPLQSIVRAVRCEVRPRNVRVAFPTNSSETQLATLNQNKDLCYAIGLNRSCNVINVQYTAFNDKEPMIVSDFDYDTKSKHEDVETDLYGKTWDKKPATVPRHQMGIPTPLHSYALVPYYQKDPEAGYPCLQEHYKDFNADAVSGTSFCKVEYHPKMGLLRSPLPTINYSFPISSTSPINIPRQGLNMDFHSQEINLNNNNNPTSNVSRVLPVANYQGPMDTIQLIEKSQWLRAGYDGMIGIECQPSLHIACQPTPALSTAALQGKSNSNFTDTQAYWEIICEMEVNTQYPTPYPLYNAGCHTTPSNEIFFSGKEPDAFGKSTFNGFYQS